MSGWPVVVLRDVLSVTDRAVSSSDLPEINLAGVYSFGRGLFKRGPISPAKTSYRSYNKLVLDDFIISQPKAWEGALARVTSDFEGWFLSPVFPTFTPHHGRLLPAYLEWLCKRKSVWLQLQKKSKGMGARRETVSSEQFLSLEIPLPPLSEQQRIIDRLDALAEKTRQLEEHLYAAEEDAKLLLALRFRDAIADAPLFPMAKVAPLVRREQPIILDEVYPELGIRSFGKGTFHKPSLSGIEVGTKRLYRIEPGDLMFSNVFAWEGAIAIAKPEDGGRFGSHRFITCQTDEAITSAGFLHYYFLSEEGLEKIGEASPGGAGRNRTLGLGKLMAIEVPIPELSVQRAFDRLHADIVKLRQKHESIRIANSALLPATLERAFERQIAKAA